MKKQQRKEEREWEREKEREREMAWVLGYSLCCAIEFHTIWGSKWHVNHEQRPACFFTTELNTGGVREIIRPLRRARQENSRGAEDSETLKGLPRAPLNSQSGAHTHKRLLQTQGHHNEDEACNCICPPGYKISILAMWCWLAVLLSPARRGAAMSGYTSLPPRFSLQLPLNKYTQPTGNNNDI